MKQYIGQDCRIHLQRGGKDLHFTAHVTDVTDSHITFIDKFGEIFTFRISEVIEVSGLYIKKGGLKNVD